MLRLLVSYLSWIGEPLPPWGIEGAAPHNHPLLLKALNIHKGIKSIAPTETINPHLLWSKGIDSKFIPKMPPITVAGASRQVTMAITFITSFIFRFTLLI